MAKTMMELGEQRPGILSLLIREPAKDTNERREMKVNLPVDIHLRLHAMKVRNGSLIADTIAAALEEYFAKGRTQP